MQNVQTEPQGNPKLYRGTARGEVWAEFRENRQKELRQKAEFYIIKSFFNTLRTNKHQIYYWFRETVCAIFKSLSALRLP